MTDYSRLNSLAATFLEAANDTRKGGSLADQIIKNMTEKELQVYSQELWPGHVAIAEIFSEAGIRQGRIHALADCVKGADFSMPPALKEMEKPNFARVVQLSLPPKCKF